MIQEIHSFDEYEDLIKVKGVGVKTAKKIVEVLE